MAPARGGTCHRIGRHEERAHDNAAAAKLGHKVGQIQTVASEDSHKHGEGTQDGQGDGGGDPAESPQIDPAQDQGEGAVADHAAAHAQERGYEAEFISARQRRGGGDAVHGVVRHGGAERDEQEAPAGKGGVQKVLAEAAEQAFHHKDGENAAEVGDVQGNRGGQAERQQQAGDKGAAVPDRQRLIHDPAEERFGPDGAHDAHERHPKGVDPVEVDARDESGEQCKTDVPHGRAGRQRRTDVRTGGDVEPRGLNAGVFRCLVHFVVSFLRAAKISAFVCLKSCVRGRRAGQV